jgi:diguanylate cyclase (GGDEF)-like protein/PAS domain S-box-containing protein
MKYTFIVLFFLLTLSHSNNLKKVSLQLQWKYQFQFAGFIVAKEKGFYKDIGLDVNIKEYKAGIDTVNALLTNKTEYSILNTPFIYKDKKIQKTVLLASYFQKNPLVFAVQSDIVNPSELKNKKIMGTHDDLTNSSLALMLNHFEINDKNSFFKAQTFRMNEFIEKKVDAITVFKSNELFELDKKKIKYNILDPYDYGFFTTATNLFTTKKYALKNSKEVKNFISATKKGWEYALNNIDEVSKLIHDNYQPSKSIESLIFEGKVTKKLMLINLYAIGYINEDLIHRAYSQLVKTGILLGNQNLENLTFEGLIKDKSNKKINFTHSELKYLEYKKELTMCINPDWMPFEKLDKNNHHIGISAEYFRIIRKQLNIPINIIKTQSWKQSLEFMKEKKCDILPLVMKTPFREKHMSFTKPYIKVPLILATKNDISFVESFNQLKGQSIAIVEGFASNEILKVKYPELNIIIVKNAKNGLQKVLSEEVIGFVGSVATVNYILQNNFMNEIKIGGRFDELWELSIAVHNDDSILLGVFEKLIKNISSRTKLEILNKYTSIKYEDRIDYFLILEIVFVAFIIILIFLYWNIKLFKTKSELVLAHKEIDNYLKMIERNVLISLSDKNGKITDISAALCKLTGYTKDELIGKSHNIFRHKDMDDSAFEDMWKILKKGNTWNGEVKNLKKDGSYYWAEVIIAPTFDNNKILTGYSAIRQNITDKKKLEKISITDSLTKISNRLYLDRNYEYESKRAKRYKKNLSIILIDIDLFKNINDSYGHNIGDDVLIEIANILKQNIRNIDKLGRWGGEEFLIICPETSCKNAEVLAENLRKIIDCHVFQSVGNLTCSFGLTKYYTDDKNNEAFIRADKALYLAKEKGRNKVIVNC